MSFDFNYKLWVATKHDVDHLIKRQNVLKSLKPIDNHLISFQILSEMFVLYGELVNKLTYLYRNTIQAQKRDVIRKLVEPVIRTFIMLKNQLKNVELSEYIYADNALVACHRTPFDMIVWRCPDMLYRRPPDIQQIIYDNQLFIDDLEKEHIEMQAKQMLKESIGILQAHERARQTRVYKAAINYDMNLLKRSIVKTVPYTFTHKKNQSMCVPVKRTIFRENLPKPKECCQEMFRNRLRVSNTIYDAEKIREKECAVLKIQRTWRAYKAKRAKGNFSLLKDQLHGMKRKKVTQKPNARLKSILDVYKSELLKTNLDSEYLNLMSIERTRLLQERSPQIMEDISDHVRAWFKEFYDKTGDFHPYPDVIKQGTVLVLIDKSMNIDEFNELQSLSTEERKARSEKQKQQKMKEREKIKKQKLKDAKRRKKFKDAGIYDIADQLKNSKEIENLEKTLQLYSREWRNVDEYLNKGHSAIQEWVTENELSTIHQELRALVDDFMRLEYELLRKAWSSDKNHKYIPMKQKDVKNTRGRKQRKYMEPTADRTPEALYQELRQSGIIEKHPNIAFNAFISDFNFLANETRNEDNLVSVGPAKGDIKMVIQECMLGLGEFSVDKPKSICIVGPQNHGKKLLCNIISCELDAIFINLSPENTHQFAESLNYLIDIVMKVAKAFQPTVLFIDNAHRIFWKRVPNDQMHICPTLLQGVLAKKILNCIKKTDKIVLLGTSDAPWDANVKFKKTFQKILLMPKSDYGSTVFLWNELIAQNAGEGAIEDYIISALAKVFRDYNPGDIANNVTRTLNLRRRMRLHSNILSPMEFLDSFMKRSEPILPPQEKVAVFIVDHMPMNMTNK